jgi:hypothetical protein
VKSGGRTFRVLGQYALESGGAQQQGDFQIDYTVCLASAFTTSGCSTRPTSSADSSPFYIGAQHGIVDMDGHDGVPV